jgi:ABC-type nickel/cobalt efflux system permease component RcnA
VRASDVAFPPGQAGLLTLRLVCRLEAPVAAAAHHRVDYATHFDSERIGWREVTAVGDHATLVKSAVPTVSPSASLTRYPQDRLSSPLDVRGAHLTVREGGAAAPRQLPIPTATGSVVRGFDQLTQSLTSSVSARRLTIGLALVAVAFALGLGALHAFAPGHGKTVMAAYLVGERGTVRDGLLIGVTVAFTHTLGVLVLGLVLTASQTFAPEAVYPYLSLASGVCFVALGVTLMVGAIRRRRVGFLGLHHHHHGPGGHTHGAPDDDHAHAHAHAHDHDHDHDHDHADHHDERPAPARLSRRNLLTLGFAGGMVPTPTAVVVLLGATAIGRAWFGALLVVAYGIGMGGTLVLAGLLLARARRRFDLRRHGDRALKIAAVFPVVTAVVITGSGLWLVARAAVSA